MKSKKSVYPRKWAERAACLGAELKVFYPPDFNEKPEEKRERESFAKAICKNCPVKVDCLNFSFTNNEPYGIWGGLNERERKQHIAMKRIV